MDVSFAAAATEPERAAPEAESASPAAGPFSEVHEPAAIGVLHGEASEGEEATAVGPGTVGALDAEAAASVLEELEEFGDVEPAQIRELVALGSAVHFAPGERIVDPVRAVTRVNGPTRLTHPTAAQEGDAGRGTFFLILAGDAAATMDPGAPGTPRVRRPSRPSALLGRGAIAGASSLLLRDSDPRLCRVEARQWGCACLQLSRQRLEVGAKAAPSSHVCPSLCALRGRTG